MKKFITINQANFIKIGKREGIKVDAIDGILFDWIRTFMLSENALKKLVDNELYIWVSYKKIREDNPLCNINTNDVIGRRLNKLEKLGLIKKFVSKEDGNKTFIALTKFAYDYLLEDRELPTQESGDYLLKSRELPTQESDNSKLIESYNSKLIENKEITKKIKNELDSFLLENKLKSELGSKVNISTKDFKKVVEEYLKTFKDLKDEKELIDILIDNYKAYLLAKRNYAKRLKQFIEIITEKKDLNYLNSEIKANQLSLMPNHSEDQKNKNTANLEGINEGLIVLLRKLNYTDTQIELFSNLQETFKSGLGEFIPDKDKEFYFDTKSKLEELRGVA
jgi:hypothetical protein